MITEGIYCVVLFIICMIPQRFSWFGINDHFSAGKYKLCAAFERGLCVRNVHVVWMLASSLYVARVKRCVQLTSYILCGSHLEINK